MVECKVEKVLHLTTNLRDPHLLNHALATLSILASSLEAHAFNPDPDTAKIEKKHFTAVDHFAPAEKNELQPRFKKTTDSAGRKQKMLLLM